MLAGGGRSLVRKGARVVAHEHARRRVLVRLGACHKVVDELGAEVPVVGADQVKTSADFPPLPPTEVATQRPGSAQALPLGWRKRPVLCLKVAARRAQARRAGRGAR